MQSEQRWRLNKNNLQPIQAEPHASEGPLRRAIEILNHLLASSAQPQPERLLRRILLQRASARVNQNSLPGLF